MKQSVKIIVHGKVQGVNYRESARRKALGLGINGTVENLDNGDVLIRATGHPEALKEFKKWCAKGPVMAQVKSLEVIPAETQEYTEFLVLRK